MSLARYLSKLGALLGSDGKVPSAALAAGAAVANLGFTPQAALGFSPLNPSNNLSELSSADSARNNLGLGVYDSGWYSVVKDASYVKTHNLGSNKLLILNYFSYNASDAAFVTYTSFHSASHAYTGGCIFADIGTSTLTVRTGAQDCVGPSPYPNNDTGRFGGIDHVTSGGLNGYYRTIAIRLG